MEYFCFESLGILAAEEENYTFAFDTLNQVVDKFLKKNNLRDAALTLSEIGTVYEYLKSYDRAIEAYSKAYELNHIPVSLLLRASVYAKIREYDKAADDINRAEQEIEARNPNLIMVLGELLIHQGLFEKAIINFQQLLELTTFIPEGYFFTGIALWGLGQEDKAFEEFQKCLDRIYRSSTIKNILNNLELLKRERKELENTDSIIDLFRSWRSKYK